MTRNYKEEESRKREKEKQEAWDKEGSEGVVRSREEEREERKRRRKTTDLWHGRGDEERRQKEEDERRAGEERSEERQEVMDGDEEAKEISWKGRRGRGEERRGPSLSADKRQKQMNPIGRRGSSSLLSPRLHELRTHFIEICEIRKAGYRVIYHAATWGHTSSWLHNKSHNWHFFSPDFLTIIFCCCCY